MKIELISVLALLFCLLIIGIEYIMHYRLAELQDEHTARIENIRHRLDVHVEGVLYAPTDSSRESEINALTDEINGDYEVYEMAVSTIRTHKGTSYHDDIEAQDLLIKQIDEKVDPVSIYAKMLDEGNVYHKGYACRRLAEMNAMEYRDKITNETFIPHVIEPSIGVERLFLAVLSNAYTEEDIDGSKRTVLKLPENLAPYKYCVSPLLKNKPELVAKARKVYDMLRAKYTFVTWDDSGNIGKRYRKQDEIGTPKCIVIDFATQIRQTIANL